MVVNAQRGSLEDRIFGAYFGFAIGDAMGATTEFVSKEVVHSYLKTNEGVKSGILKDIIGGGWLHLKPGKVTDDTQMMIAVTRAFFETSIEMRQSRFDDENDIMQEFLTLCCLQLAEWYDSKPIDIGTTCQKVMSRCHNSYNPSVWMRVAETLNNKTKGGCIGNGAVLRCLPLAIAHLIPGMSKMARCAAKFQGDLTHSNRKSNDAIDTYIDAFNDVYLAQLKVDCDFVEKNISTDGLAENSVWHALANVCATTTFEGAIIKAVNQGGDADSIAALTGGLAGFKYGCKTIPDRWLEQLDKEDASMVNLNASCMFTALSR